MVNVKFRDSSGLGEHLGFNAQDALKLALSMTPVNKKSISRFPRSYCSEMLLDLLPKLTMRRTSPDL
jgi:hypothetical protein